MVDIRHRHKRVVNHIRKHHKKYLVGGFGLFGAIKAMIFVLGLIPAMIGNYHVKAAMSNTILYQIPEQVGITYTDTQGNNFPMGSITLYSGNYSYEILDRDLGANELSGYGYYFQWGNNYGFSTPISNTTSNQVDASNYGPNTVNGYYVNNAFYDKKNKNWDRSNNGNLWGDTTNTNEARQGPCPTGYHVPSSGEIQTLYDVFLSLSGKQEYCDTANDVDCFSDVLYIAKAGEILPNNQQNVQGTVAHWYSSTPVSASMYAYSMQIDGTTFSIDRKESRAYGKNIRCFSNDFGVYKEDIQIYTVIFETEGGNNIDSVEVISGNKITEPDAPIKTGYEFAGWYKTGMEELWNFEIDVVTGDMILYAKWEEIPVYTVEFETDGGTEVESQTITGNEHVLEPEEPIKIGYEFMGWYKTGMEELWNFEIDVVTGDMTLYARWEEIPVYTVEFETDGGTEIDSQIVTGNEYVLQPENPIKTGYAFSGWYLSGTDELWNFDTDVVTGDMTLYAKWEEIPVYTVEFETDGGTEIDSQIVTGNEYVLQPENPIKTGYEFVGWYKTGMEELWKFETYVVTGDMTLYAKWEDVTPPTFNFSNNSGYECVTGIVRVNNLNDNEELADNPISFDGINWDIVNTFDIFPKKGNNTTIITGYVKDLAGNISTNISIFTFVDTGVTATGFTVSRVGTGISVNWKENTNAQEGDCGDFYLSAEVKTQGRIGVCSIVGDYVVYIPNDGEKGNDLCEIRIQDMENNNVNVTVNFTDIFSIEGILDAKIFATDINLIGRISTHIQNLDYISDTGALTIIDQKGLDVGRYTMISISNLTGILGIGNYIDKSNVYIKSNSVYTISGDINNDVKINTGLSEFVNIGSPILYMYRNLGQNNRKIGEYGSDFTIRINIPAYQLPDVYVGTIIFTIYENE